MTSSSATAIPDRDAMLGMSDEEFVGLWQQVVGERPAILIERRDMVAILAELRSGPDDAARARSHRAPAGPGRPMVPPPRLERGTSRSTI